MQAGPDLVKERILAAAVKTIDEAGTAALRVVAVADEAGVSQGMIRYYFGDRQGLVDAALARRFGDRFGDPLAAFAEAAKACNSQAELRLLLTRVLDSLFIPERTGLRLERNADVGEAVSRPELAAKIAAERDANLKFFSEILADAQSRGLMRADLDPTLAAAFHMSMIHGYSLFELGGESLDMRAFNRVYQEALFGLIFE